MNSIAVLLDIECVGERKKCRPLSPNIFLRLCIVCATTNLSQWHGGYRAATSHREGPGIKSFLSSSPFFLLLSLFLFLSSIHASLATTVLEHYPSLSNCSEVRRCRKLDNAPGVSMAFKFIRVFKFLVFALIN